jgi:hypothetical protein
MSSSPSAVRRSGSSQPTCTRSQHLRPHCRSKVDSMRPSPHAATPTSSQMAMSSPALASGIPCDKAEDATKPWPASVIRYASSPATHRRATILRLCCRSKANRTMPLPSATETRRQRVALKLPDGNAPPFTSRCAPRSIVDKRTRSDYSARCMTARVRVCTTRNSRIL